MKRDSLILLSKNSHKGMISYVVEVIKEPTGYLIGSLGKRNRVYTVRPIQTADRKKEQVSHGNYAAVKRVKLLEKVWERSGEYIGGFHAHIVKEGDRTRVSSILSDDDIKDIEREMKEMKKDSWIEVLLKFQEREFERKQKIGEVVSTRGRKLDCRIVDTPYHSYDITFSAYLIDKNLKVIPLTIRDEKIVIERRGYYNGSYRLR